uniref:Uncharacterized protein n=1 Tax=Oryza sativa subsp. japonica TaxID=39947 RepID=Q6YS28_ORYSJ|nr:hypothetical protein [Oryza sativa Japonica Group]
MDASAEEGVLGSSCRFVLELDPLLKMPENHFFMATTKSKGTRLLERGGAITAIYDMWDTKTVAPQKDRPNGHLPGLANLLVGPTGPGFRGVDSTASWSGTH